MQVTIKTSGSTGEPKWVTHDITHFMKPTHYLIEKWGINRNDVILNPFPTWTIANWAFCVMPSIWTGARVVNVPFELRTFWDTVDEVRPTIMTLAVRTMRALFKMHHPDLSYLRHFATGSAPVEIDEITLMKETCAQNVWNIYGSTECIPPVFLSNDHWFGFDSPYTIEWYGDINRRSLKVDGVETGDLFYNGFCMEREENKTWKNT